MKSKQSPEWYREYYRKNRNKILLRKKKYSHDNREKLTAKAKNYYIQNKEKVSAYHIEYNKKNKAKKSLYHKAHYAKNRLKKLTYRRKYVEKNKDKVLASARISNKKNFLKTKDRIYKYRNQRYATNIQCKISDLLRKRFRHALRGNVKSKSAIKLLGCSIEDFKNHIASKFKPGMSWQNHGKTTWHIDHIRPCSSFNLADPEQQRECFHHTNMQPLFAFENHSKNNRYTG